MTAPGEDVEGANRGRAADQPWALPGSAPSAEPIMDYPTGADQFGYPAGPGYSPHYPSPYPQPHPSNYPQAYPSPYPQAYPPPPMPPPYLGSPAGYSPAPGYGGYSMYGGYGGPGAVRSGTNSMALTSLISSVLGLVCCWIAPVVGIVCGTIALNQIKQTREDGYAMAVAGLVISIATLLIYFIVLVFSISR